MSSTGTDVGMHDDEVPIDIDLVRRLIADQFSGWAHLPIAPVASSGTDNALYRLGPDLVIRLPKIDWAVPELERRAQWLPRLAPHLSLPVAQPIAVGQPDRGYPWKWSIYPWLPGRNPTVGDIECTTELAADLAAFIRSLRCFDPTSGPPVGFARGVPVHLRDRPTRAAIANLDGLIDRRLVTEAWEASLAVPPSTAAEVWLHADLSPGNLLVVDAKLSAVLDFTPGVGLPDCELIVAWNLLPPDGRAVLRSALDIADDAWIRGRGWALTIALLQLDYYRTSNPALAANALHVISEVVADTS